MAGTAVLLVVGLSAICLDFSPHSPVASLVPGHSVRLLLTGLIFAGSGSLVALSPLGRRSGAHLNPAMTFAFWCRGHVHAHDLIGYTAAQIVGAFAGTAFVAGCWGARARAVSLGLTEPGAGVSALAAVGIEAAMTAALILGIMLMVSSRRSAPWTPLLNWLLVAALVWQGARWTGTSLNPARSLAPAGVLPHLGGLWIYFAGPLAGALVAVAVMACLPGVETLTAKLYHDDRYRSTLGSSLPVRRSSPAA